MPNQDIRIEQVKVKDLYGFAEELMQSSQPGQFIPITLQRALAMVNNPFGDPDDVALLVAYSDDELIGYFGIMAVKLQHDGNQHKAHWFTTWMVSRNFLGRGVGSLLMQAALDLEQDYFIIGSKPARRVCDKFGFQRLPAYEFSVIDFRVAARYNPITLLLRGIRKAANMFGGKLNISKIDAAVQAVFETLFGWLIRPVLYTLALSSANNGLPTHQTKQVSAVQSPIKQNRDETQTYLLRGDEIVNWMLECPWVLQPGQSLSENLGFNFSDTRPEFEISAYEFHSDDYRGYAVFQFSVIGNRRTLKVLDVAVKSETDLALVLPLALQIAKEKSAHQIEIAPKYTMAIKTGLLGKLIMTQRRRICQVRPKLDDSPLAQAWPHLQQSYVDGDTPFT